jgi:dihydrofolate reductase/thymidylate synthase
MGRKTWESIPEQYRPLPNRLNIVLSGNPAFQTVPADENNLVHIFPSLEKALESLSTNSKINEIFIIGGASLYEHALNKYSDYCKLIIKTRIMKDYECDTFMPKSTDENAFATLYVSKTYSHKDITYDYMFQGNRRLLEKRPELIPTRLFEKYPKHAEM